MDKTSTAMAGAVGALVSMTTAQGAVAAADPVPAAQSFAELLEPIPNAVERLALARAADAAQASESIDAPPQLIEVAVHDHGVARHHIETNTRTRRHHQPPRRRHHTQRHEHT